MSQEGEGLVFPRSSSHLWEPPFLVTKVRNYPVSLMLTALPCCGATLRPDLPRLPIPTLGSVGGGGSDDLLLPPIALLIGEQSRGAKLTILRAHLRSYKERSRHLCKVMGAFIPRAQRRSRYERKCPLVRSVTECVRRGDGRVGLPPQKRQRYILLYLRRSFVQLLRGGERS